MKRIIIFNILTFLLVFSQSLFSQEDFRKAAPKAGPAPRITLGKAETFTLKNGLKVIVVENHKLPRVSFQVFVDAPPLLEGEAVGYADLAGQLLDKGTATKTKAQIDEAIDFIGASLGTDASGVTGSSLSRHREKLLELLSDVLLNPSFPQEEFEKLKKQTISGLAAAKDEADQIASNVASVVRNGKGHPYGEVMTEQTVEKITVDKAKSFYQTYFKPNISYLIVTGDISLAEVKKLAPKYFDKWQKGTVVKTDYATPQKPKMTTVDFVDKTGAVQSVINITYPIELKPGTEDAIKASVMNSILGGSFGSRLFTNLREDKAYTYGAYSSLSNDPVIGDFNAYASVRNEVTDSAIVQFLLEMNLLRTQEVPDDELNRVKNVLTGNFARSLENPATVARFTLNIARYGLPADYYATYLEKLSKVTKQDVMAMAKKYVTPENAHILVVGNKDDVSPKLKQFLKPEQKIQWFDAFGNPVQDSETAIPAGVTAETVLADYIAALGGAEKIKAIQSVKMVASASVQGMTLESVTSFKEPGKMAIAISMMSNVMQQVVFDGQKGANIQMGQSAAMQADELADMKVKAHPVPELFFKENGVKTELKGVENVDGKKTYKLIAEYPSGSKKTAWFDISTSLKIREVETADDVVLTYDYADYREVSGVKFPYVTTISGAMPFPLKLETISVEVNAQVDDGVFKVE